MREKKNILLCVGAVLSGLPFVKYLADLICSAFLQKPLTGYNFLAIFGNVVFVAFVVILAVLQIRNNCKCRGKGLLPIVGIVVSSLYLLFIAISFPAEYPRYFIYKHLYLLTIQYFVEAFVSNFLVFGVIGHILLLIGHIKSIPVGK